MKKSEEEILCRIRDLQRAIIQFETDFEKCYGICLNEGMTLCSLKKKGRLSASELGDLLGLSHSNMSKVIKSVEKKGYVERVVGEIDKRQMYFSLTGSGDRLIGLVNCDMSQLPEILQTIF